MDVLVRVDVGRGTPDEIEKAGDLAIGFDNNRGSVFERRDNVVNCFPAVVSVDPFAEIDVEADAELWVADSVLHCIGGGGPAHHQARTRYNAALVGRDNAAIDAVAEAEVISIDDKMTGFRVGGRLGAQCLGISRM